MWIRYDRDYFSKVSLRFEIQINSAFLLTCDSAIAVFKQSCSLYFSPFVLSYKLVVEEKLISLFVKGIFVADEKLYINVSFFHSSFFSSFLSFFLSFLHSFFLFVFLSFVHYLSVYFFFVCQALPIFQTFLSCLNLKS